MTLTDKQIKEIKKLLRHLAVYSFREATITLHDVVTSNKEMIQGVDFNRYVKNTVVDRYANPFSITHVTLDIVSFLPKSEWRLKLFLALDDKNYRFEDTEEEKISLAKSLDPDLRISVLCNYKENSGAVGGT